MSGAVLSTAVDGGTSSSIPVADALAVAPVRMAPAAPAPEQAPPPRPSNGDRLQVHPFSTVALGFKVDTLGGGVEVATPLARRLNLRATVNFVDFSYAFSLDGIAYTTKVNFRSGVANLDWFPFHGRFRISPGFVYFNNSLGGTVSVDPGKQFTLNDVNYINSIDDPVGGKVGITYARHMAPMVTIGTGNIIPRNGKHFSMPFEVGLVYTGAARMDITLSGTACTVAGCFNAATDPTTQQNLQQEIQSINQTISKFPFYPVLSTGVAFRF
ncbi:MAG: hypothetical protein KGK08_09065 [Acidobacteriota bacterium]|nr:hypothetical protein [Acidobacteriota bacterium]